MNEFLELVTERPEEKLWKQGLFCPYCNSEKIFTHGTSTTLVAYIGEDKNHTITSCTCGDCQKKFTRETKGKKCVWFAGADHKILRGIPYCFESYTYTCKHCGGDVQVNHYNKSDNKNSGGCMSFHQVDGKTVCDQYNQFECNTCHAKIITDNYYYYEG
jgi:hypothetical protein